MQTILVDKNSTINTIKKALNLISSDKVKIILGPGIYREKVEIEHNNLSIIGQSPYNTIIINGDYARKIHSDGNEFNTFRTSTVMIIGSNINLENLQIINDSGYGEKIGQAVALSLYGNNILVRNSILKGYQDTLFLGPLPVDLIERYENFLPSNMRKKIYPNFMLFENCFIEGSVDFIFGSATAYFKNCTINSLLPGFITAPSTPKDQQLGFTFWNCLFTSPLKYPHSYLARPWRDFGQVVFINCQYDIHIYQEGFNKWSGTTRDQTCRFYEYNCSYLNQMPYQRIYFSRYLKEEELTKFIIP